MDHDTTVQRWEGPGAIAQLDTLLPAYEEIYAEPPYCEGPRDVAEFISSFRRHATDRPGFRVVLASDAGEVTGFAYGFLLPAETGWWSASLEPLPDDLTEETGARTFAVIELAVRKPWRRRGIAGRLHETLIGDLPVERVTLTMRPEPEAAPAQAAYARWGYRRLASSRPWDEAPLYDLMLLQR